MATSEEVTTMTVGDRRFNVTSLLGKGGFSIVMKAKDEQTDKKVALKIMFMDKFGTEREKKVNVEQVHKEIKAMRQLSHPNIIRLYGYDLNSMYNDEGKTRPCIVLVQEMASHGELFEYLMHTGKFEEPLARYVFQKLMAGLGACHSLGLAHRDLKPENVLLSKDFTLKLADFGFAYPFRKQEEVRQMRTELGTRGYMAPEFGRGNYSEKVDFFSSGVILFILLSGFPPFRQTNGDDWWFEKIMSNRWHLFWQAHERKAQFSEEAKALLQGMLAAEASDRFDLDQINSSGWVTHEDQLTPHTWPQTLSDHEIRKVQFKDAMKLRKEAITKQRGTARDDVGDALQAHFQQTSLKLTRLDAFTDNQYRAQFKEAEDEESLREAFSLLAGHVPALGQMLERPSYELDVESCLQYMSKLYDAENLMRLLKIPNSHANMAEKILEAMNSTQLGISLNENTEQFICAEDYDLPEFEGDVGSSANTYRIRVGLGTIAYLLLPYCQEQIGAEFNIDGENAKISLSTAVKQMTEIPNEENPTEFEQFEETFPLEIVIKFYREPVTEENAESFNVMAISGGNNSLNNLQVHQEFVHVVNQIINETNVGVCIVQEQNF